MVAAPTIEWTPPAWALRYEVPPDLMLFALGDLPNLSFTEARDFYHTFLSSRPPRTHVAFLGLADLYFLLTFFLNAEHMTEAGGKTAEQSEWLYDRCREVQADPDGHLDLWAREHYKSTIITYGHTILDILRNPDVTIGIFSHQRPAAKAFLRQIKIDFEQNEELKAHYPDVLWSKPDKQAPKWSEDDGLIVRRESNPKEATLEAWGLIDGMPIGKHFVILLYDDVVTDKTVTNPEMVQKVTERFELSDNLGTERGVRRYIGTRYHLADTYGKMIDRGIPVRLHPATHNGLIDGKPVFISVKEWERKKRDQPSQVPAQMLLNPAGGKQGHFRWQLQKSYEILPRTLHVYILIDPAKGPGRTTDRTAMAVIGVDAQFKWYLLDGYRHRMDLGERWIRMRDLYRKWTRRRGVVFCRVFYERYGMQSDLEHFSHCMKLENFEFPIEEVNWPREGGASKIERVDRMVPKIHDGQFLVPALVQHEVHGTATWHIEDDKLIYRPFKGYSSLQQRMLDTGNSDLVGHPIKQIDEDKNVYDLTRDHLEELMYFPFGLHDDLLDAESRIFDAQPVAPKVYTALDTDPRSFADGT
jgi:hypothetical protein